MAGGDLTNSPKAPATGGDMGFEHSIDRLPGPEIGVPDDRRADLSLHPAALCFVRHRGDELGFADRPHCFRPAGAVGPEALQEHRGDNVVAGVQIGQQLIQVILVAGPVP